MNEQIAHRYRRTGQRIQQQRDTVEDEVLNEGEYDDVWPPRLPASARRYQSMPDVTTRHGRVNVVQHYHQQPLRANRPSYQQLPPQRHSYTDEDGQTQPKPQRHVHWLVWVGAFLMLLVSGWIALNVVTSWWQGVQDNWTYGQLRHFNADAVVGHTDSSTSPSHFIAENNKGDVFVIELPGGDSSKAKIYQITTIPGNDANPPVRVSFQDVNHDGKSDLIVQIGDTGSAITVILFNNGSQFVSHL